MMQLLPNINWDGEQAQDKRPLPELIAMGGSDWAAFDLQFTDVDGVRYYAVQDWIAGVALTDNPRRLWTDLKSRYNPENISDAPRKSKRGRKPITKQAAQRVQDQLSVLVVQLPYLSSNGKTYRMDHTTAEGLYFITELMESESGIRDRILAYLAAAGVKMDEYRLNPSSAVEAGTRGMLAQGVAPEKVKARTKGIVARNEFGAAAHDTHYRHEPNYMALTTKEYQITFGRGKSAIVAELGLTKAQADHFRDHLDTLALQALDAIETTTAIKMRQVGRALTDSEQTEIITEVAKMIAPGFQALAGYVGIDLATGKPLLGKGEQ